MICAWHERKVKGMQVMEVVVSVPGFFALKAVYNAVLQLLDPGDS